MAVSASPKAWRRRPVAAASIRCLATLTPLVASVAVGWMLQAVVSIPEETAAAILRWLLIVAASIATLVTTDALARRVLPLATLLQLSLAFPDELPSRFKLALQQGSGRRLARATAAAVREGVSDEPREAAEQLVVLAASIGDHDRRTRGHSERVRLFAELIGEELGLDDEELAKLQWAGLIHDIGKVTVPTEILNKRGVPDAREWDILHQHPEAGAELVKATEPWLGEWVQAVESHHERWDGTGYPRGLAGREIPRAASIIAVADSFEVMTAIRSYKTAMTLEDARVELTRSAGSHFDPEIARALLNVSIPKLRRAMGILAALAHVPFLGRVSTAAAYAPDAVSTAVTASSTAATAGAGAVAVSAALAAGAPGVAPAPAPEPTPIEADRSDLVVPTEVLAHVEVESEVERGRRPVTQVATPPPATVVEEPPAPEPPGPAAEEVVVTATPRPAAPSVGRTDRPIPAPARPASPAPTPSASAPPAHAPSTPAPPAQAPATPRPAPPAPERGQPAPPADGGIGQAVSEMAKDPDRSGGIGAEVREMARQNGNPGNGNGNPGNGNPGNGNGNPGNGNPGNGAGNGENGNPGRGR